MLKEASYKEKFVILKKWMPEIIETVKKDLKAEHLKKDWMFAKKYFPGINLNKVTSEELSTGYQAAMDSEEKGEEIAEFISNCWLLKNGELYHYFEEELSKINVNFNEIEVLEPAKSAEISENAIKQFGAYKTYLFSVLNSVAFQEKDLNNLKALSEKDVKETEAHEQEAKGKEGIAEIEKFYNVKIARLTDKFEKKISGLQKKYMQDVEAFKKQIAILQSKLTKSK
jgi:hypothetical protein